MLSSAITALLVLAVAPAAAVVSEDGEFLELRLAALDGRQADLSQWTEQRFVIDYDEDGPVTQVIETGCGLSFTPQVQPDGSVMLALELSCTRIEDPVPDVRIHTPFGRQKIQRPAVESFTVSTIVVAGNGETVPVDEPGAPAILVTPEVFVASSVPADPLPVMLSVMLPGYGIDGNLHLPDSVAGVTAVVVASNRAVVRDTSAHRFITGFSGGDPAAEILERGCSLDTLPTITPAGGILTEMALDCGDLVAEGTKRKVRTRGGEQKVYQPALRKLHLQTAALAADGETRVVGGIHTSYESVLFTVTPRVVALGGGVSPRPLTVSPALVHLEARMIRAGSAGAGPPPGPSFFENLRIVGGGGQESTLRDLTGQMLVTGSVDGSPVVETVESGCSLIATPVILASDEVHVSLRTECVALEKPGQSFRFRTRRHTPRQKLTLPILHALGMETAVTVRNGETLLLGGMYREGEDALLFITTQIVRDDFGPQALVEVFLLRTSGEGPSGGLGIPAESFLEAMKAVALDGREASVHDRTKTHVLGTAPSPGPVTKVVESGCSMTVVPSVTPGDTVFMDIVTECLALDRDVESKKVEGRSGPLMVQLPVTHQRRLTTQVSVRDGGTIVLGGVQSEGEEALFFVTPRVIRDALLGDQVLVETRTVSVTEGAEPAAAGSPGESFFEELHLRVMDNQPGFFESMVEQFVHTGVDRGETGVEAVEGGCSQEAATQVLPGGDVVLDTDILCRSLDLPVKRMKARKIKGHWKYAELPVVHEIEVKGSARARNGGTMVLAGATTESSEVLVFVTPRLSASEVTAALDRPPQVDLETKIIKVGEEDPDLSAGPLPLCETIQLIAEDGQPTGLDTLATEEVLIRRRGRSAVATRVETGVLAEFTPRVGPAGTLFADLALECLVVEKEGGLPLFGARHGNKTRPQRQVLALESVFIAGPGETIRLAGSRDSLGVDVMATMELLPGLLATPVMAPAPPSVRLTLEFVPRD
jgi:type II secretory pathway component HofQ